MAARMRLKVVFERDELGLWVASIPKVPGCHTQGRSIAQARQRIREALEVALMADLPDEVAAHKAREAYFVEDVRLPARVARKLQASRTARKRAEAEQARAQRATLAAVRALTESAGLSVRDAGELLGLSHQRIQQLQERTV